MSTRDVYDCSILVVDDEVANLDLIEGFLSAEGYRNLTCVADPRRVLAAVESSAADLVLLDLHMPHVSGFEILERICERTAPDDYLPVLVLTADVTSGAKERALSAGARDFVTKPFDAVEILLRVRNLLETRVLHRRERNARRHAEAAAERAALLSEASRALGGSLDGATAASQLARRLVPELGDSCAVLVFADESVRLLAAWPESAAVSSLAERIAAHPRLQRPLAGCETMRVEAGASDPATVLLVPIAAGGGAAGILALARDAADAAWTDEQRTLLGDVGARTALALENTQLFAAAESARRARERMMSVVAHDLRNPLAAISMYAEMMLAILPPDGDPYQRDALGSIFQSSARMQQLIEDLLDVSSLLQGAFPLRRQAQPLAAILDEADRMLRPLAEAKGVEMTVSCADADGLPAVTVDAARLLQVLSNLIGNAVKHTPAGGTVRVAVDAAGEELLFSVADTGAGIPEDQVPHIFDAFRQARVERRGVGLGLWIARAIVEAHGGRIWVESRAGTGAAFRFTIPHARVAERELARLWVD